MTTFIMTGRYSGEALKKISARRTREATKIIGQGGGRIVAAYATMGKNDLLAIVDFPSVNEAMKASIELNKVLGITFSSVPAIGLEDFDKLMGAKG